jgi:hypothetical protein
LGQTSDLANRFTPDYFCRPTYQFIFLWLLLIAWVIFTPKYSYMFIIAAFNTLILDMEPGYRVRTTELSSPRVSVRSTSPASGIEAIVRLFLFVGCGFGSLLAVLGIPLFLGERMKMYKRDYFWR